MWAIGRRVCDGSPAAAAAAACEEAFEAAVAAYRGSKPGRAKTDYRREGLLLLLRDGATYEEIGRRVGRAKSVVSEMVNRAIRWFQTNGWIENHSAEGDES